MTFEIGQLVTFGDGVGSGVDLVTLEDFRSRYNLLWKITSDVMTSPDGRTNIKVTDVHTGIQKTYSTKNLVAASEVDVERNSERGAKLFTEGDLVQYTCTSRAGTVETLTHLVIADVYSRDLEMWVHPFDGYPNFTISTGTGYSVVTDPATLEKYVPGHQETARLDVSCGEI